MISMSKLSLYRPIADRLFDRARSFVRNIVELPSFLLIFLDLSSSFCSMALVIVHRYLPQLPSLGIAYNAEIDDNNILLVHPENLIKRLFGSEPVIF